MMTVRESGGKDMMYYIIALCIVLFDQVTKWLVVRNMDLGESIPIIEDLFYITYHINSGAAFGILQGKLWLFVIVAVIAIGVMIYLIHTNKGLKWFGISVAFLLGGAIGNLIDRIFRDGGVVDFFNAYIFSYNFPIFNIADIAVNIGAFMLIVFIIKGDTPINTELKK